VKLLGHRGARHEAPENTLPSIELALAAGVDGVEVDVHMSADGRCVVIHDETVDRTTDGAGRVSELTFAQLRELDAGDGAQVPALEEVLEATRGRAVLFVELKGPGCEDAVVQLAADLGLRDSVKVKAFDHRWVARVKELDPGLSTGCLIYGRPVDPVGLLRAANADFLSLGVALADAELTAACHAAGLQVCAWNCNDPDQLPRLQAMDLDWLGTDAPSTIVPAARGR
jgi:glycerophosphoryl diester phosphodiesterase